MMRVLTWLEGRGVTITAEGLLPATVGELLSRLDERAPAAAFRSRRRGAGDAGAPHARRGRATRSCRSWRRRPCGWPRSSGGPWFPLRAGGGAGDRFPLALPGFRSRRSSGSRRSCGIRCCCSIVVRRVEDNSPVGHVVAYGDELSLRHTYVGAVFHPTARAQALRRKRCRCSCGTCSTPSRSTRSTWRCPGSTGRRCKAARAACSGSRGCLRDHDYYAGRLWDKYVCALYPDDFLDAETPTAA